MPVRLRIPESLQTQLLQFRRRLWRIKLIEAVCGALCGLFAAFLTTYALDRLWDTPGAVRGAIFVVAVAGCAAVPRAVHRWVWRQRTLEQLARLLSRKHPSIGDQLLGILELSHDEAEQARSRTLCAAAIEHVARQAEQRDFHDAVPSPRHREWSVVAGAAGAAALIVLALYPAAAVNAWQRLLRPWDDVPRYTFTVPAPLPERLVVPHGEAYSWVVPLAETTRSRPRRGEVRIGSQPAVMALRQDDRYVFALPPQIDAAWLWLSVGDYARRVRLEPMLRPELTTLSATAELPDYLQRPERATRDVRSGTLSLVRGSRATLAAAVSRPLRRGEIDGVPAAVDGSTLTSSPFVVSESRRILFQWEDEYGLSGREPFALSLTAREDEPPTVSCENLPRQKVVLDTEQLPFKVFVQDDFGVKQVGMEWEGIAESAVQNRVHGERILSAGAPDRERLEVLGAFSAASLKIEPQPIALRVFAVDYLPGRERVYSPRYVLYVLNAEQHAIWITEQLSKWHRQSLEVRDRELSLYETNKQLRDLPEEELNDPQMRQRLEAQSAAERANGRRLSALVASGEDLVKQAARNPEMGVGHLEKWAEMLQILKDISANRMPSVADLLKNAAQQSATGDPTESKTARMAGQNRGNAPASQQESKSDQKESARPPVPRVTDVESSQQPASKDDNPSEAENKRPSNPTLRLPTTMVQGTGKSKPKPKGSAQQETVDEAVKQQEDLLAEFDKIAEELNRVLANLEGSTLVKRLKAAARLQNRIALKLGEQVEGAFGVKSAGQRDPHKTILKELSQEEEKSSLDVSYIMDDMQAYFERRRYAKFQSVLEEMRKEDVLGSLRTLADDIPKENGVSMALAEFWSDTLDRWAEDLVDPACKGSCPGCKSKGSLPPSIVLEVLQILEGEVNLREETRVAEQSKSAVSEEDHGKEAARLSETQGQLRERIDKVEGRIRELPDAEADFAYEIKLMGLVSQVMREATEILARPETGSPAIAAETEAIELLLKSKRFNPKGGGGGGSTPGGGGGGDTTDSALALLGKGVNEKEVREDHGVSQSSGESGRKLPEEFRAGLDEYFNRLERRGEKQ
jgi:hypothetical protein